MKKVVVLLFICCAINATSGDENRRHRPRQRQWRATAIANKLFGHRLFSAMTRATNGSFLVSPYAVSAGLSMTLYGARGETADQIRRTLGYQRQLRSRSESNSSTSNLESRDRIPRLYWKMLNQVMNRNLGFTLTSANRMFGEESIHFREHFVNRVEHYYGAALEKVNFSSDPDGARTIINRWVANMTNNTIEEAMPDGSITSNTLLALVSTLYFKGKWVTPFNRISMGHFNTSDGKSNIIEFMEGKIYTYYMETNLNCFYLQLPYYSSKASPYKVVMELLLPISHGEESLHNLEKQLNEDVLDTATHHKHRRMVKVKLPKFRLEYQRDLKDILINMGIVDVFSSATADLSGISEENLSLSTADHKTFMEVNEGGTTAGASFAQAQNKISPPEIIFDRPFIIIIREQYTQMPLFMGRIVSLGN